MKRRRRRKFPAPPPPPLAPLTAVVVVIAAATSPIACDALSPPPPLLPRSRPRPVLLPTGGVPAAASVARPSRRPRFDPPVVAAAAIRRVRLPGRTSLSASDDDGGGDGDGDGGPSPLSRAASVLSSSPSRSLSFSAVMALCGASLGPFLDSYHSLFGVLTYDSPIEVRLWGTPDRPALVTSWWVPPLFGLAGFLIGWLYVLLDEALGTEGRRRAPSPPVILAGISLFTSQYWLSGAMYASGCDRTVIAWAMWAVCGLGFAAFDGTAAGSIASAATAVGGPLIEVGLISALSGHGGYHYADAGETGFFPLWIVPVYFLGGPAVGNLARGAWNALSDEGTAPATTTTAADRTSPDRRSGPRCDVCNDTRAVGCPNCDARGYYVAYGRRTRCGCCDGRGYVMCRACFDSYGDDPNDIERIREIMSKMPD